MDCAIIPTRYPDMFMVSTTDFFYPLVEDPYVQGRIACANVLSDMYAAGIVDVDNMLMLLAVSIDMSPQEQAVCTTEMIKGFTDLAHEAGTRVTGGQTVRNPWPIIGGVAMSVLKMNEIILPEGAEPGDVIVLTKPLGTQVAVNAHQWLRLPAKWERVANLVTQDDALYAYNVAMASMSHLNKTGARLMHKYGAHAATDVTGFGILGHAKNLAKNQKKAVKFKIHTLPIIKNMAAVDEHVKIFKLLAGLSSETSGGLFICMPKDKAEAFCKEIEEIDKRPAWIIGTVEDAPDGERNAEIAPDARVLEI